MKKLLKNKILAAFLLLVLLAFGAAACGEEPKTLTDLLIEVNSLPKISAEGEIFINIHDLGMETDFAEDGLPAELLQGATIKYQGSCDNETKQAEIHLTADFPCYAEPLECTIIIAQDCVYFDAQDMLKLYQVFALPEFDEYAEAEAELRGYDWLAFPLDDELDDYYYYNDLTDVDLQQLLDEVEKFRSTIGQAYAGFSLKAMTANGSSFKLELDNAGLAELIIDLIDYTLDNFEEISKACIDYVNSSAFFEYEREDIVEFMQEAAEAVKEITPQEREYIRTSVKEALTKECPMDFNIKYNFAKTAADTYTLDEELGIIFDEEYYGESSDVLISIKNTSKAIKELEIKIPTENILYPDDLEDLEIDI